MTSIAADCMEVKKIKSLVSASNNNLTDKIIDKLGDDPKGKALRVKSLGVGLAAGVSRNSTVQNDRLKKFNNRLPRFRTLRAAGVDTARLARTGGGAALMHGSQAIGVPPPPSSGKDGPLQRPPPPQAA